MVDEDCDVRDWNDVMWRVCSAAVPERDVIEGPHRVRSRGRRAEIDFEPPASGMGIDATMRFKEMSFPPINRVSNDLTDRVAARWKQYGLD